MANETKTEDNKQLQKAIAQGRVEQARVETDGTIVVPQASDQLQSVDIADVDLVLGFNDGSFIIISNGALDAASHTPHNVVFNSSKDTLDHLFKLAGQSNPAKAGSLRVVTEHVDSARFIEEDAGRPTQDEPELPAPPAPIAKVSAGASLGKGPGKGPGLGGSGEGEGEVAATVTAVQVAQPPTYRTGHKTLEQITGQYEFSPGGEPNFTVKMFTTSAFKVTPSGRSDLPSGAYDPALSNSPDSLAVNASPANQSRIEAIYGTAGNDVIAHNSAFSSSETTWTKALHLTFNNYSIVNSVEITITGSAVTSIPGFSLAGTGITLKQGYTNVWTVDLSHYPTYKETGIDIEIAYTVGSSNAKTDFIAEVNTLGITELANGINIPSDITNTYAMTWRNATSEADFTVSDANDQQMMVLPAEGVGVEIFAGDGNDSVHAGAGGDIVHGDAGDDTLYGGTGNDTLDGGLGSDSLYGETGTRDTATYINATDPVTADLSDKGNNTGEAAGDSYSSIENLEGSLFSDKLTGDSGANQLSGLNGNDTLEGRGGLDTLDGGDGSDTASYSHSSTAVSVSLLSNTGSGGDAEGDTLISIENLIGSNSGDILIGNNDNNTLDGGAGNDTLTGGKGSDSLIGGDGAADVADYSTAEERVVATLTSLSDITQAGDAAGDRYDGIENLSGSKYDDHLIGDGAQNTLIGGAGNDTLEGMGAADHLSGGAGTDTASYAHATAEGVVASLTLNADFKQGTLPVRVGHAIGDTYDLIENLDGSAYDDTLIGNTAANSLYGGDGNDILEGMAGADTLSGGGGNNTASYEHWEGAFNVGVVASLYNPTTNTGDAAGDSYSNIQNLTGSGFADYLVGDNNTTTGNSLSGGGGDDTLEGKAGADSLDGGNGSDTASYSQSSSAVTASLMNSATDNSGIDAVGDHYTSIENLTGTNYSDTLYGDHTNNILTGNAGNDTLEGMKGADQLIGGDGDHDVASYSRSGLSVYSDYTTNLGQGVIASLTTLFTSGSTLPSTPNDATGDTYSGIEDITGSTYNDLLIGNSGANILRGGTGDDTLEGMLGADSLVGGDDASDLNNTASYDHAGPVSGATGVTASLTTPSINTGEAAGDSYVNIRNLLGSAFNDTLQGDQYANILTGNDGDDTLEGMLGADTLKGGDGSDTASYTSSATAVRADLNDYHTNTGLASENDVYELIENLLGSDFNDTLVGSSGINRLDGGKGDDLLIGNAEGDQLIGGDDNQSGSGSSLTGGDTASFETASTAVTASLTTYFGYGGSVLQAGDALHDTYSEIENLTGSNHNDLLIGDPGTNILTGGDGNDTLEGMGDADKLVGGNGSDTASYAHAAPTDAATSQGIVASLTDLATLANGAHLIVSGDAIGDSYSSIENLLGSDYNDTLVGSSNIANSLTGGTGNDLLEGLGGVSGGAGDSFNGSLGYDTVSFDHASASVVASLTTSFSAGPAVTQSGDAENAVYSSVEYMLGSKFSDQLIGNEVDNSIAGGDGNDTLEGMAGADTLRGGDGTDTASFAHATSYVYASLTDLSDSRLSNVVSQGMAAGDHYIEIENLEGSVFNDYLIGTDANNSISGGAGDDTLEGLLGNDTLDGGTGTNTASYAHATYDTPNLRGVAAYLQSEASNTGDASGDHYINIQNLVGSSFNDILYGTDTISNVLIGGDGDDTIYGGPAMTIVAGATGDTIYGGLGNDAINSNGAGSVSILGEEGNDIITLTSADTTLDYIYGGTGIDTFVWDNNNTAGSSRIDVNLNAGTVNYNGGGPVSGTYTYLSSIENISVAPQDYLYIYPDANDNIIYGGTSGNVDYVDYRYANAGVHVHLSNGSSPGTATGGSGNDTLYYIDYIYAGSAYDDVLVGNSSSNWIRGGSGGNDYIDGGAGTDTWYIDWNGGAVTASLLTADQNEDMGIVMTGDAYGETVVNIENIYSYYSNSVALGSTLYGNENNNYLQGNAYIEGFKGSDTIYGFSATAIASYKNAGNSYLKGQGITTADGLGVSASLTRSNTFNNGDAYGDTYTGTIRNLYGSLFSDWLEGDGNNNTITGSEGNDVLAGRFGADYHDGGNGIDWVSYADATSALVASLQTPQQNLDASITLTGDATGDTFTDVENIIGTAFNDKLYGNAGDNILIGGAGNDTIDGLGGNNTISYNAVLAGLDGTNQLATAVAAITTSVTVKLSEGTATGTDIGNDTLYNINRVIGGLGNDTIIGSGAAETFDGGGGVDSIDGGGGSDTLSFDSTTSGSGTGIDFTLGASGLITGIENILGSQYNDTITGSAADNTIEGGLGNDSLIGGGGADTASYANATGAVSVNLTDHTATGAEGNDTLTGFAHIIGSAYADLLIGDTGNNSLAGGGGDDTLIGGNGGNDSYSGGAGIDTVDFRTYSTAVSVDLTSPTAPFSGIEILLGGSGDDSLTGNTGDNTISGGSGNDTLHGGGGSGIDTVSFAYSSAAVQVILGSGLGTGTATGDGIDSITSFLNIIGSNQGDTLTGNAMSNMIVGGAGNDTLDGLGGIDTVSYASALNPVTVDLSHFTASGGIDVGTDTLSNFEYVIGSAYSDSIMGDGNANSLDGGAGNDTLTGLAGADTLVGGSGSDTASYVDSNAAVYINLSTASISGGHAAGDVLSGIENLTGSNNNNDTLYGSSGDNVLTGGTGNDYLQGYDGNDTLHPSAGNDTVYGGNHDDTIVIDINNYTQTITDGVTSLTTTGNYWSGDNNNSLQYGGGDTLMLTSLVNGATYSFANIANVTRNMEYLDIRDTRSSTIDMSYVDVQTFANATTNVGGSGTSTYQIWVKADSGDVFDFNNLSNTSTLVTNAADALSHTTDYSLYNASGSLAAVVHWQVG